MRFPVNEERPPPGEALDLIRVDSRHNRIPGMHGHAYPEIFWLVDGPCQHRVNGVLELLRPGDGYFLRPRRDFHQFLPWRGRGFGFINFVYSTAHHTELSRRHPEVFGRCFPAAAQAAPLRFHLPGALCGEMTDRAQRLLGRPSSRFTVETFLFDFIQAVFEPSAGPAPQGDLPDWLARAVAAVREPEVLAAGVAGLARAAGRSPEHLARSCRRHLGRTPGDLVAEARLQHARKQLLLTGKAVAEIARECGYTEGSRFHRLFRSQFGTSPLQYRRRRLLREG